MQGGLRERDARGCGCACVSVCSCAHTQRERVSVSTFELQCRGAWVKGMLAVVVACVQWREKYLDPLLK